mmetsp:Transcript_65185/g.143988  ORF Transcript_65185/g.143988 Transcript_65185/m.143988 type:complete len:201 (-) Transcript_65185:41-643(-)
MLLQRQAFDSGGISHVEKQEHAHREQHRWGKLDQVVCGTHLHGLRYAQDGFSDRGSQHLVHHNEHNPYHGGYEWHKLTIAINHKSANISRHGHRQLALVHSCARIVVVVQEPSEQVCLQRSSGCASHLQVHLVVVNGMHQEEGHELQAHNRRELHGGRISIIAICQNNVDQEQIQEQTEDKVQVFELVQCDRLQSPTSHR